MNQLMFSDHTEYGFWGNVEYATNAAAKEARDAFAKELKARGKRMRKWVLRNQLRQYAGFGQPDGRSGHVYKITVY